MITATTNSSIINQCELRLIDINRILTAMIPDANGKLHSSLPLLSSMQQVFGCWNALKQSINHGDQLIEMYARQCADQLCALVQQLMQCGSNAYHRLLFVRCLDRLKSKLEQFSKPPSPSYPYSMNVDMIAYSMILLRQRVYYLYVLNGIFHC